MKTSKPFSTISYNTKEFLIIKLDELITRRKIAFYSFIHHLPEDDETKEHKHLLIVPNGQITTEQVIDYLLEIDNSNPTGKPLGCIPCRSSKFGDWFLYSKHDKDYLASKGQTRKYTYQKEEFICSDNDYFNEEIHSIDLSHLSRVKSLREAVEHGKTFESLLITGQIPIQQVNAYKTAYSILEEGLLVTTRNGRETHQKINKETGEIDYIPLKK